MNTEIILRTIFSTPLLTIGTVGGAIMVTYLATQWWTVMNRHRFESKRNSLELTALKLKVDALNHTAQSAPESAWNGYRKFTVSKKVEECEDTHSFYLKPHNGKKLPPFKPGQYLTFSFKLPGTEKPLVRCYSLSDGFLSDDHYRVTIKRCLAPGDKPEWKAGVISSHFCDGVKEGDILDVKAPSGRFYLDMDIDRPVVLISGGIGITPMLAMARALTHAKDNREIFFFFGCRSGKDHMFRDEVVELQRSNPQMRMHICYSRPDATDVPGEAYNHESRVTVELMKEVLPSSNYEYYLCGPGPFMETLVNGLYEWGVPKNDVKFEAFGPATVKSAAKPAEATGDSAAQPTFMVEFARSGKSIPWEPGMHNLLAFAEGKGITTIEGGCRAGSCGSCLVAIKEGEVEYEIEPGDAPEEGSCLSCICRPKGKIIIDA